MSSDRRKRRKRRAAGVVLALAVALLVAGAATLLHTMRFVQGAERTTGTVIDLSEDFSSDDGTVYYPVVRFTTAEGRTVEFRSSTGSSPPPDVGDRVEVLYDSDDPQDAQLSGFFDLWLWPIAFGVLAIGFGAFALFSPGSGLFAGRVPWPGRPF